MGGRGASSASNGAYEHSGRSWKYGDEYSTLFESDGMKFIQPKGSKPGKPPIESQTPNRVYAVVNKRKNSLQSIEFYDENGKATKHLHFEEHKPLGMHAHDGFPQGKARALTPDETILMRKAQAAFTAKGAKR